MQPQVKHIPGTAGKYSVSDQGDIFGPNGCIGYKTPRGDLLALITLLNGKKMGKKISHFVAEAFLHNPDPNRYKWVVFKDGNKLNCKAINLEWSLNTRRTFTEEEVLVIKSLKKQGVSYKEISRGYGVPRQTITSIICESQNNYVNDPTI